MFTQEVAIAFLTAEKLVEKLDYRNFRVDRIRALSVSFEHFSLEHPSFPQYLDSLGNTHKNPDGSIMHAEIKIGESTIMMGECGKDWTVQNAGLFINVENTDKTFEKAIYHGSEVLMPISDKEYGRTCGVRDPFGNTWWITQTGQ